MEIVLISCPYNVDGESDLINHMFDEGLTVFHLRKPEYNENQFAGFLEQIKPEYYSRIKVHSTFFGLFNRYRLGGIHIPVAKTVNSNIINLRKDKNISISCSFHSLDEAIRKNEHLDYAFLSPVFDSISKKNYKGKFDFNELRTALTRSTVILG
jgi:thiamine-phosphate pyrophosphorylase